MKNLFLIIILLAVFIGGLVMMNQSNQSIVVLLGAPGSGKGTQATQLSKALNIPHISTGDLFRENMRNHTALGTKAKEYIDAGQLVPDALVLDMLFDRVAQSDCKKGYLLDGFPRTIPQAEALTARIDKNASIIALNIDVNDDVVLQRITGRLSCQSCGSVYHKDFAPPKIEGKCNNCDGELYQRTDDSIPVMTERLRVYHEQTAPLIGFFDSRNVLKTVDGSQDPAAITTQLLSILNKGR